jgi:serine/threonine protein kinase, bacterial
LGGTQSAKSVVRVGLSVLAAFAVVFGLDAIASAHTITYAKQEKVSGLPKLNDPADVVVGESGNLYVLNRGANQVFKRSLDEAAAVSTLPFTGLNYPSGLAVDAAGDVFVADSSNNRVVELLAGSESEIVLPFTNLDGPVGIAVDVQGDVFVSDTQHNRVVELIKSSGSQVTLPFTDLSTPRGLALDQAGDLLVADWGNSRVVELSAGSSSQKVLPFTGLEDPCRVLIDSVGDDFVSDCEASIIEEIPAGTNTAKVLPFSRLGANPGGAGVEGVAVDAGGDVYADDDNRNLIFAYQLLTPPAPSVLATSASGKAVLTWPSAPYHSLKGYNVYEGTYPGGESTTPVNPKPLSPKSKGYTVSGLTSGQSYYFTVKAINLIGTSPPSHEVAVTP